tara:strand:- start:2595 stop:2831 length:237 start_codon:yes stop_codon:yes gene_type:complete
MLRILCLCSAVLFTGCAVSEETIKNKELYCSEIYKGIRAVGRVATEVTTGVSIPDVCDTIDEIVEEDAEATSKSVEES